MCFLLSSNQKKYSLLLEKLRDRDNVGRYEYHVTRRGPSQDAPFNLIIWYTTKKIPFFFGIGPIRDVYLKYIFRPVSPFLRFIEVRYQYYNIISNTHLFSNFFIMTMNYVCTLFWCKIRKNVHFEGLYLFTLHQYTAMSNIKIWRYSHHIISTDQTLNDGALSCIFGLKPIKLRWVINICLTTGVLFIASIYYSGKYRVTFFYSPTFS